MRSKQSNHPKVGDQTNEEFMVILFDRSNGSIFSHEQERKSGIVSSHLLLRTIVRHEVVLTETTVRSGVFNLHLNYFHVWSPVYLLPASRKQFASMVLDYSVHFRKKSAPNSAKQRERNIACLAPLLDTAGELLKGETSSWRSRDKYKMKRSKH